MNDDNLKKYDKIDKVKLNIEKLHSECAKATHLWVWWIAHIKKCV